MSTSTHCEMSPIHRFSDTFEGRESTEKMLIPAVLTTGKGLKKD